MPVVVAEDGDYRRREAPRRRRKHSRLVGVAVCRQVAREEDEVGAALELRERLAHLRLHSRPAVEVAGGGDPQLPPALLLAGGGLIDLRLHIALLPCSPASEAEHGCLGVEAPASG
jgi:hypothetical protein